MTSEKKRSLGARAAEMHWDPDGSLNMTWNQVASALGVPREKARSAARRYRRRQERPKSAPPDTAGTAFSVEGNYARASSSKSSLITSVDELLLACGIDEAEWRVLKSGVKQWAVGAKAEWKDLTFDEGKISGFLRSDGIQVEPLWSVWVELAKVDPDPIFPTISPVVCDATFRKPGLPQGQKMARALIFADTHMGFSRDMPNAKLYPFHDRDVLDVILQVAYEMQPDRIIVLGDFMDFVMWTDRFLRSPKFEYTTQPAINEGHWWLRQFREACRNASISVHEGNHEKRISTSIMTHLRAAYGLRPADNIGMPSPFAPESLLGLASLGIEWIDDYPDDYFWLGKKLRVSHGSVARQQALSTTTAVAQNSDVSEIVGHIHRIERCGRTRYPHSGMEVISAICPGCTCSIDGIVPSNKRRQQWQNGFAIVDYIPDGDEFSAYVVEVRNGKAVWNGNVFEAIDRVPDLRRDMPEYNW